MMKIGITPLTNNFGVTVHDVNLANMTSMDAFPSLRDLFEEHSLLLFHDQNLSPDVHLNLAKMFGPIEDRKADERVEGYKAAVSPVSNQKTDGSVTAEDDLHTLHLKTNQLWHVDSSFMPTPALCNILTAKIVSSTGGETEIASTRAAWSVMPEKLKAKIRGKNIWHKYSHSRAKVSQKLSRLPMFNKWSPQKWPAVWTNPVNNREALYVAAHSYLIDDMGEAESQSVINELIAFCTRPEFTYSHKWKVGDVLIWDQRAALHRGMPWPYDEPRTLVSVCCSMTDADGLAAARTIATNT